MGGDTGLQAHPCCGQWHTKVVWILYELSLTCVLVNVLLPFHCCGRRWAEVLPQQPSIKHLSKRRGLDHRSSVNIHYSQTQDTRQWQPGEKLDKTDEKGKEKKKHSWNLPSQRQSGDTANKLFCGKNNKFVLGLSLRSKGTIAFKHWEKTLKDVI